MLLSTADLHTFELHLQCVISPQAMPCLTLLGINLHFVYCAGLADANSSAHAAFATNYETLLASVLSVPASQAQLESLQTGAASAPAPARRRLLHSQVGHHRWQHVGRSCSHMHIMRCCMCCSLVHSCNICSSFFWSNQASGLYRTAAWPA